MQTWNAPQLILAAIIAICWRGIDEFVIFAPLTTGAIRYDIPTRLAVTATGHYPVVAASPWRVAGEIAIAIPAHVRLVMVANDLPALTDPLVSDVLRALTVSPDQVLQLTPEKSRCCRKAVAATAGGWVLTNRYHWKALRWHHRRSPNYGQTQRHAPRYGNKFAHMNTISSSKRLIYQRLTTLNNAPTPFRGVKTFASNQGERYLNFQLTQNGKMAAFAITQVVLDEATLFNIAVDPDYQRQGLGRALLEHLIDELEKRGVATLWLEVRASNAAAIALYESLGFNEATIRRNYYPTTDGREDAIIMALPISM